MAPNLLGTGPVLGSDPTYDPLPADAEPTLDTDQAIDVSPAPIDIRDGAGGVGGGSTYTVPGRGIELRPAIHQPARPVVRTEDPAKRTEHSRVFANPDGTYTAEISQGRLNYKDANGHWQPLDLSLVEETSGPYGLRVKANDATVRFSATDGDTALARMADGAYSIGLRAIGYGAASTRTDSTLAFPGAGANGKVGVLPTDYGFEFQVTIDRSDRATVYHFALDTGGLVVQLDADGATVLMIDPDTNQTVGRISAPMLLEGHEEGDTSHVSVQLIGRGDTHIPDDVPAAAAAGLGANEVLLTYRIDPTWLHSPDRQFPVVLDPSVCIRYGTGCNAAGAYDIWIDKGNPTWYIVSSSTSYDHVGYYYDSSTTHTITRGLFYFPDIALPDEGAVVTSATMTLTEFYNYSGTITQNIYAQLLTKPWQPDSSQASWNNLSTAVNAAYDSPTVHPCSTGGTVCGVNFSVDKAVRAWYTRRTLDWKPNLGFEVRYDQTAENANKKEVSFYRLTATTARQPKLTINYVLPAVGIDFAPELGNTYAPSAMGVGKITKLPIIVRNNSSFTFNTTTDADGFVYKVGYRWFDDEGKALACPTGGGDCTQALPGAIGAGANSGTFALNIQAPAAVGSYTLRLDLAHVHVSDSKIDWASDWAKPSKYYSRNKNVLTSDNTRWVGSSIIERDEFGISVGTGGGTNSGELKTLPLSDGNTVAINLGSANLHYQGGNTVGFSDLIDLGLAYGYDLANVADCSGVLNACGWYTNWDERLVPQGNYSYLYQGPSGNRYLAAMDGDGQITGGAPALIERTRFTLWDESNLAGWSGTAPVVSTSYNHSGTHSLQIGAAGTGTQAAYPSLIDVEHFRDLYLWVKSTGTDKAAIGFKILDRDDTANPHWFFYTFGNTSWTVPSNPSKFIDTDTALTSANGYWLSGANLLADVRAAISGLSEDLSFQTIDLRGSAGGTGSLYYDDVSVRASASSVLDEAPGQWSLSTDHQVGTYSLLVNSAPLATSLECVGCVSGTDLLQYPWMDWWWKKSGGNSIAEVFYFTDARDTSKTGKITYYAGPVAPSGADTCPNTTIPCVVQVSPTLPAEWSHVRRNLLGDARQLLNFYNDYPLGSLPSDPPSAPAPDGVTVTGYKLSGVDGNFALFDAERQTTAPMPDPGTGALEDFSATYGDRSRHYFNADGLLERVVDRDGNTISLDWTYDFTKSGPAAYTLTKIHAPSDGTSAPGGTTYRRYLEIARDTTTIAGLTDTAFIERLGTAAAAIDGRRNDVWVSTSTTTTTADPGQTYGPGDLVAVSPIQKTTSRCDGTRPTGCDEFSYLAATAHQLRQVRDPRWNGTITGGPDDKRWKFWYGAGPTGVTDLASGQVTLNLVSYDAGSSSVFARAIWQDADARAANTAQYVDLSPEGSVLVAYAQKPCQNGSCTFGSTSTYPVAPTTADIAASTTMDGLARITSAFAYRVAGTQRTASRSGSNAAAKVDNYADPLAAGQIAWSQTNDQFLTSLKDSGGMNPDLYRTEYAYDADHQLIDTFAPAFNATPRYADVINSRPVQRKGYWRLDDASGNALDQANTYPLTVTATGVTRSQPGGLINDPDTAMTFVGASSGRAYSSALSISQSAYTLEAWVKVTSTQTDKGLVGDFNANSGAAIVIDANGHFALAHNTARIVSNIKPAVDRWYHVAASWDANPDTAILYVDGVAVAEGAVAMAPGTGGASFEIGAYGNGLAGKFVSATIDEAAYYDVAISPVWVAGHYQAGRSFALVDAQTAYDSEGHPTQQATSFLANGGFEGGLAGWGEIQGADPHVLATPDATINSGFGSLQIDGGDFVKQPFPVVPGQAFHFQVAHRTDGVAGTHASIIVEYWRPSTSSWVSLKNTYYTSSTWATHSWDFTLPMDANGLVEVVLFNGAYAGTAWFDDAVVVTDWRKTAFASNGLLSSSFVLGLSGGIGGTILTYHEQAQTADHPGIFDTSVTGNYVDGVPDAAMDTDVITTHAVDAWGRTIQTIDADGFIVGAQTFAANKVDVASITDGAGRTTTFTYDTVGNRLTSTAASGRVTASTYDMRNHVLTTTAPDGVVSRTDYDGYGRATASWANYVNGTVESSDGDLTDDLLTTYAYDAYGRVVQQDVDCGSVATCAAGGVDARTASTYDLLGNMVTATAYASSGGGSGRTTTNHFETFDPIAGEFAAAGVFSRATPSGVVLAIAPSGAPAPLCPETGSSTRCNSVSAFDLAGRTISTTDAYGIVSRTYFDLAGRPVRVVANATTAADDGLNDQNVTTDTVYDLHGNPVTVRLPLTTTTWRSDVRAYDALDRVISVTHKDSAGATVTTETTTYLRSGRIRTTSDGSSTTETRYDALGRASATIAHSDPSVAGMTLDAFEGTTGNWNIGASGVFTTSAATARTDDTDSGGNAYNAVAPVSGRGRLHVTTHATNTNDGAWLDISGPTYQSGHVYKAAFDLAASAAGLSLTAYLGQDQAGGSYGSTGITSTTTWTRYTVSWTAGSNLTTPIRFAVGKAAAGTAELYLDNLVVWDSTTPDVGIVSSLSAYNADGEIIASVLPPGDPATERPLVTTVAFDPAGRTVESVTNGASGGYAAAILGSTGLAAYVPLDERTGTGAADKKAGGTALTVPATLTLGVAGGIDEARTGIRLTGANGYLSRSSNATSNTTGVSMEAWIRTDTTPAATVVVAANGSAANGWGIGIDAAGKAAGFTLSSSTFTTMASSITVSDGAWHHLVLTRGATTWAMTIDGAAQSLTNSTTSPGTPAATFTIGALSDGTRPFVGEVDEVSAYTADISGSAAAHLAAGRRTDATTALTTRNAYDRLGRVTDAWAPDLVRTRSVYDRLGNQVETVANYRDGVTTGGTADDVRSTFAYDVLGELVGYCPAEEVFAGGCNPADGNEVQAWRYAFDALGRQVKTIPPVNTTVTALTTEETVYELGGRTAKTCRYPAGTACASVNSRHVDFTYDALGRALTQKTYDRGAGSDTLKYTKTLTWNADGTPASVADDTPNSPDFTYLYDTAGRLSQFKTGSTVLTAYTYTAGTGTIATRTDGTQGTTAFTWDWARRQTVIDPPDTYATGTVSRTYRLDGLLATQSFPASLTETLAYDAVKRPTSISLGAAGSLSQAYDRAGSVTSDSRSLTGIAGDAGSNSQSFSYDALHRVTGSTGLAAGSAAYQYDLDANRTRRVEAGITTDYLFDRADQLQQQTIGGTVKTFSYDAFGNLTQSADKNSAYTTFGYDEASRLTSITPPTGGQVAFTLDAVDRPATRSIGGTPADTYAYLDATDTAWLSGSATTTGALLDAAGTRLALKTGMTVSWLAFDLHGSVAGLCPAGTSSLSDAYRYDAWGMQVASAGTATNPYRYRGLLNLGPDDVIGALLAMGAREYASQLGTFTQEDSVAGSAADPASMNRYLYALANPATLIDPDGHCVPVAALLGPEALAFSCLDFVLLGVLEAVGIKLAADTGVAIGKGIVDNRRWSSPGPAPQPLAMPRPASPAGEAAARSALNPVVPAPYAAPPPTIVIDDVPARHWPTVDSLPNGGEEVGGEPKGGGKFPWGPLGKIIALMVGGSIIGYPLMTGGRADDPPEEIPHGTFRPPNAHQPGATPKPSLTPKPTRRPTPTTAPPTRPPTLPVWWTLWAGKYMP